MNNIIMLHLFSARTGPKEFHIKVDSCYTTIIVLYCIWPFKMRFSQHEPFRSAPKRKGRIWCRRKM